MRLGPAAIAAPLLVLALILPGCGDEQTSAAGTAKGSARAAKATTAKASAAPSKARAGALVTARRCRRSLGDFLDSMESLNNSLAVGLSYDAYLSALNHVRSTYAPISANQLPLVCLAQVASPAEQALNTYIAAANVWGDCLATTSCDPESIEPRLQRKWREASSFLSEAELNA